MKQAIDIRHSAIVADHDPKRRAATAGILRQAGFAVEVAAESASLAMLLSEGTHHILVADSALAIISTSVPVLLMADAADSITAQHIVADYTTAAAAPGELAMRATALIARNAERLAVRERAATLREGIRSVTASMRSTNDAQQIADTLVRGLSECFEADHVRLVIFADQRIGALDAEWIRPAGRTLPAQAWKDRAPLKALSDQLWEHAEVLLGGGDQNTGHQDHARLLPPGILPSARSGFTPGGPTLLVPVGEGSSALGILQIAPLSSHGHWGATELGLVQHVVGNAAYSLLQSHLIARQQEVLQRLRQLDQAKLDFLSTVNHELRTPLTSIVAYLDLLQDGSAGPLSADVHRMLDIISRNATRLSDLVGNMLGASNSAPEGNHITSAPLNLGRTLQLVTLALRPLAEQQGVTISYTDETLDVEIPGDEVQLQRLFTNIVSNAIKFTPTGGSIHVTSQLPRLGMAGRIPDGGPAVEIRVIDSGVGIPPEELPEVFTRFYRASNAMNGAVPGSGLGLAICEGIVRGHGGDISVTSTLGKGTQVRVRLPFEPPE